MIILRRSVFENIDQLRSLSQNKEKRIKFLTFKFDNFNPPILDSIQDGTNFYIQWVLIGGMIISVNIQNQINLAIKDE